MTLNKKISCWVLGGLLLMFLSAAVITFCIERYFYREQLNLSARNVAISLSLTLAQPLAEENNKKLISIVDDVFSCGDFDVLQIRNPRNEIILTRSKPVRNKYAPNWFVSLTQWTSLMQAVDVRYDDIWVGTVSVRSDPAYASDALWNGLIVLLAWYLFWFVVSLGVIYYFAGWLLTPLQRVVKQIKALGKRQFLIETHLSSTWEFNNLALAMNQLVVELKKIFQNQLHQTESLRSYLLQDKLTGFGNRRYFLYQLSSLLAVDEDFVPGFIIAVSLDQFVELKQQQGDMLAEQFIKEISSCCFDFWQDYPDRMIARISEGCLVVIIKENDEQFLIKKCDEFNQQIQKLASKKSYLQIFLAVVSYQGYHDRDRLISAVEQTILTAKNEPNHSAFSANLLTHHKNIVLVDDLKESLAQNTESLHTQVVGNGKAIFHQEIMMKIQIGDTIFSDAYLMPMIRRVGLCLQLDRFVMDHICERDLFGGQSVAFTLTDVALADERFLESCVRRLELLSPESRVRLCFEVDELFVFNYYARLVDFFQELQRLGVKLGVNQAGIHFSTMHYLNELPLRYLKLHGSLSHELDPEKEFIIHYIQELAHIFGIQIIATELQNQKEWHAMGRLGIEWGQGVYFNSLKNNKKLLD